MKSINYCRCFIMSELKYLASKNGLKYKIVRFEAGPEGKRAKINQKAATVDFTVYPARFEPILELTKEELEEILLRAERGVFLDWIINKGNFHIGDATRDMLTAVFKGLMK